MPGVISSILLIVVGAIARYAYSDEVWRWTTGDETHSLRVDTVGMILLFAGIIGLMLSAAWSFYYPRAYHEEEEHYDTYDDDDLVDRPKRVTRRKRRY